ncbi:MAG TPA: hypothetical protein VHY91_22075 [Pirellulales bacterium]|jgi:DNA-binding transcriptional regulator YiaG|nr:hypothetical protein [Pirellulales bacterium]
MAKKHKPSSIERDLIEGLEDFTAHLKSDAPIEMKYTVRRVALDIHPKPYTPTRVKSTRQLLRASQVLFGQFLGVSVKTVRAWEQGKSPSVMACRFMDEIQRNPDYWRMRLKESLRVKTA